MRAVLGLALIIGGAALTYMAARGRTPFDATSTSSGAASNPSGEDTANRNAVNGSVQNPTAASQQQHNGGLP